MLKANSCLQLRSATAKPMNIPLEKAMRPDASSRRLIVCFISLLRPNYDAATASLLIQTRHSPGFLCVCCALSATINLNIRRLVRLAQAQNAVQNARCFPGAWESFSLAVTRQQTTPTHRITLDCSRPRSTGMWRRLASLSILRYKVQVREPLAVGLAPSNQSTEAIRCRSSRRWHRGLR